MEAMTMTPAERTLLARNKLLRDIRLESVAHVLKDCRVTSLKRGETLLERGQRNSSLYLLLEGELRVYLGGHDLPEHAVLGPGECVGELSLIDGGNTTALVMAAEDTRMLVVPHDKVWLLVDSSHDIAHNLLGILAGRIRNNNLLQVAATENTLEFEVADNIDGLTGLYNRRWAGNAFPRMILRCERSNAPHCLLRADIDHFKSIKDTLGYLASDEVLKGVARIMKENLRPQDLLASLGGDKFAILLPETPPDLAMKIAERLSKGVATSSLHIDISNMPHIASGTPATKNIPVTVSIGIAAMQSGDVLDSMFAAAEEALYQP